ncbi:unnamed protein product [Durusdinium trenchii]|uniref:ADP-ribosylation factor n=1 Tax=Durusdinium trenchii TaxID=1381693 RepID=A0ABP0T1H7_9DINO
MGIFFSKVWARLASGKEKRLLMVGLDAAGKTTILYRLRLAEAATTVPTIGFNMETVEYRNIKFDIWDVGGQDQIRKLWRHYFKGTDGLIYVVDSADRERINDAKEELEKMLKEVQLQDATLLVLANKQDLKDAMPAAEIMQEQPCWAFAALRSARRACSTPQDALPSASVFRLYRWDTEVRAWPPPY